MYIWYIKDIFSYKNNMAFHTIMDIFCTKMNYIDVKSDISFQTIIIYETVVIYI